MRLPFILLLGLLATLCFALHPANIPAAKAKIAVDGSFELKVRFDILAYCLDLPPSEVADAPMNALLDGPASNLEARLADARRRFQNHIQVLGDGSPATVDSYSFADASDVLKAVAANPKPRLPVMTVVVLKGQLPAGSRTSSFRFPESLGEVVLTTEFPYQEPVSEPVEAGSASTPLTLPTAQQVAAVEASIAAPRAARSSGTSGTGGADGTNGTDKTDRTDPARAAAPIEDPTGGKPKVGTPHRPNASTNPPAPGGSARGRAGE
ncbi:MAG: hypothetical protein ACHQ50_06820, partial [Fimbriimonadales bacterium]